MTAADCNQNCDLPTSDSALETEISCASPYMRQDETTRRDPDSLASRPSSQLRLFFLALPFCESVILFDLNATRRQLRERPVGRSYRKLSLSLSFGREATGRPGSSSEALPSRETAEWRLRPGKRRGSDTSCAGAASRATVWCWRGALHGEGGGGSADVTPPIPEGGRGLSRRGRPSAELFPLPLLPRPPLPLSDKCHTTNHFQL